MLFQGVKQNFNSCTKTLACKYNLLKWMAAIKDLTI